MRRYVTWRQAGWAALPSLVALALFPIVVAFAIEFDEAIRPLVQPPARASFMFSGERTPVLDDDPQKKVVSAWNLGDDFTPVLSPNANFGRQWLAQLIAKLIEAENGIGEEWVGVVGVQGSFGRFTLVAAHHLAHHVFDNRGHLAVVSYGVFDPVRKFNSELAEPLNLRWREYEYVGSLGFGKRLLGGRNCPLEVNPLPCTYGYESESKEGEQKVGYFHLARESVQPVSVLLFAALSFVLGFLSLINGFNHFFKGRFGYAWAYVLGGVLLVNMGLLGPIWLAVLA